MRRFGLIGYPLGHSFSKKYFTDKFAREGLEDCVYDSFPIPSIDELPGLFEQHPDLIGLNVTIPYKLPVLRYLDVSYVPEKVRACNCIRKENGRLAGYNTDIAGFERSFLPLLKPYHKKALVLGNGGATAAVAYVLDKLGMDYRIVSRELHGSSALTYGDLDEAVLQEWTVIINTTPLGMFPDTAACPPIPYAFITPAHYLFDLVYNPDKTLFLQKGEQRGAAIKNGYEMLVIQAEESWRIWNTIAT